MIWFNITQWFTDFAKHPLGEGIIIGLTVAFIIGVYHSLHYRWVQHRRQQKQIKRIAKVVLIGSEMFDKLSSDLKAQYPNVLEIDIGRIAYNMVFNVFNDIMNYHAYDVPVDNIIHMKSIIGFYTASDGNKPPNRTLDEYHEVFKTLENLSWIKKHIND